MATNSNPFLAFGEFYQEQANRLDGIEQMLIEIKASLSSKPNEQPRYLKAREAAKYLRISLQSVYKLTMDEAIPFTKKRQTLLFKTEDLDKWLQSGKSITL